MPVRAEFREAYEGGVTPSLRNDPPVYKVWWWMLSTLCNNSFLDTSPEDELVKTLWNAKKDLVPAVQEQLSQDELKK